MAYTGEQVKPDGFYRVSPTASFLTEASAAILIDILASRARPSAFRDLIEDDSSKCLARPYRFDFEKLFGIFQSVLSAEKGEIPFAQSLTRKHESSPIIHAFEVDENKQPLRWRTTLEYVSFNNLGETVYSWHFRMPNDGFLYLHPEVAKTSPEQFKACPGFEVLLKSQPLSGKYHESHALAGMSGWYELPAELVDSGVLQEMQDKFIAFLVAHPDQLPQANITTEIKYNPTYRRMDITLHYRPDSSTLYEWQLCYEPGFPERQCAERVLKPRPAAWTRK
jgi:hypothetical protein